MTFLEYQKQELALRSQIATYATSICDHEKEIALDRREIVRLEFECKKLLNEYAQSEESTFTGVNLQGEPIKKGKRK